MQQKFQLRILPQQAADDKEIIDCIAKTAGKKIQYISGFHILKKSIDARSRTIYINLQVNAFIDEPFTQRPALLYEPARLTAHSKKVIIVGTGPAGLFAALQLLEKGIKPILIERGKEIRARRRDLARLNKEGIINAESNYCFGEGGAGTYSDGKLYTRSNKRGNIDRILSLFVKFGATENILYDSHPHIGTNKLPQIITAITQFIIDCGGEVHFEKKFVDFHLQDENIKSILTQDGDILSADAYILATGHSARDVFELLHQKKLQIEAKPFALGVRVEHPQPLIDSIQYAHNPGLDYHRPGTLPPASYALAHQVNDYGVFSFCMCPGGIIAPASTAPEELVVNGWSPSKRNNPFANSGMVVQVDIEHAEKYFKGTGNKFSGEEKNNPLQLMHFQQAIEQKAFTAGGGNFVAPAQRMDDFVKRKLSSTLPANSYLPGLRSSELNHVLPAFIYESLAKGFKSFGKKMPGYYTQEAVVVATESRTSSPVRIPRDKEKLSHPQVHNLYPCAEGAGYAGGIVSAAMDGEAIANVIASKFVKI